MATLNQMLSADPQRYQKANGCSVQFLGKQYVLGTESLSDKMRNILKKAQIGTYRVVFKFLVTSETGHSHKVYIQTVPLKDLSGEAQVFCDCNDFKFRCAYGLNQGGSLLRSPRTDTALGEAITTAPKKLQSTVMCKHALAAIRELTSNPQLYLQ